MKSDLLHSIRVLLCIPSVRPQRGCAAFAATHGEFHRACEECPLCTAAATGENYEGGFLRKIVRRNLKGRFSTHTVRRKVVWGFSTHHSQLSESNSSCDRGTLRQAASFRRLCAGRLCSRQDRDVWRSRAMPPAHHSEGVSRRGKSLASRLVGHPHSSAERVGQTHLLAGHPSGCPVRLKVEPFASVVRPTHRASHSWRGRAHCACG